MATVSPRVIYDYLLARGVSPASAAGILANIQAESGFNPGAIGDGGTSGGLFQHHAGRWTNLKNYAASTGRTWSNWQAQVDFALKEARGMGINLQSTNATSASMEWTLKFERPADAQRKAQERARYVSQYNYGGAATNGAAVATNDGNAAVNTETQEQLNLPSGGSWFRVPGGYVVAYRFYGNPERTGASQVVYFSANGQQPPPGTQIHSQKFFDDHKAGWTDGGTVDSFRGVPPGKSYQDLVNDTLFKLGLAGTDALKDPGVLKIVALAMTREMSPEELANRLRSTAWYQKRTDKQREWDDLSQAEKDLRAVDEAMQLSSLWFTYVGEDLVVSDYDTNNDGMVSAAELKKGNPDLFTWANRIASGEVSQSQAVNSWMKEAALENANSPWSRTVREEEQAQGQHQVDVENTAAQVREMYEEWGNFSGSERHLDWANKIVMNQASMADLENALRTQAAGLYPGKPPELTTREYASPYIDSFMQTLETSEPSLRDALVQRAMKEGMTLADFGKMLRHDDRWLETDNARVEMNETVSTLGRVMGF